jgi:hypothetical protein
MVDDLAVPSPCLSFDFLSLCADSALGSIEVSRKCISVAAVIDTVKTLLRPRSPGIHSESPMLILQTQWKKRKQTPEERKEAKRAKLDPDRTTSAANRPAAPPNDATVNGEEPGLTRSQIKNRAKKTKKLRTLEAANTKQNKEDTQLENKATPETKSNEPITEHRPAVNGTHVHEGDTNGIEPRNEDITATSSKSMNGNPSTAENPSSKVIGTRLPSTPRILTNGIKSSPSPSSSSTTRSPSVPIISSPVPEQPSPSSIAELHAKLAARISQARVARKAIGTAVPGAPQTREAILEARAKRKAIVDAKILAKNQAKKELLKATQPIPEIKEESSEDEMVVDSSLSFGRVMVNDTEIDAGKGEIKLAKKRVKGPSDPKGRLEHLKAREKRVSQMDPGKAGKAIEHDRWHHALLSARGEKVKDDMSLLKKTISRREREKKKSKREWNDRTAKVEKGKEDRQRKREENIAKRREDKGRKGKKVVKPKKGFMAKKRRPGFEGGRIKVGRK